MRDLKRGMTALGAAARTAVATKPGTQDAKNGDTSGALPPKKSGRGESAGTKVAAEGLEEEAALEAAAHSETPGLATAASTSAGDKRSGPSGRRNEIAAAIAALSAASSDERPVDRYETGALAVRAGEGPPDAAVNSNDRSGESIVDDSKSEAQPPQATAAVGEDADESLPPPRQSGSEQGLQPPTDGGNAEEPCAAARDQGQQQERQQGGPLNPVALAAVAPLNEQVRGVGVRASNARGTEGMWAEICQQGLSRIDQNRRGSADNGGAACGTPRLMF